MDDIPLISVVAIHLFRVSVVNEAGLCIYDELVKPSARITDYNTQFSGINETTLRDVTTTLADVQKDLLRMIREYPGITYFVGHSLDGDLR